MRWIVAFSVIDGVLCGYIAVENSLRIFAFKVFVVSRNDCGLLSMGDICSLFFVLPCSMLIGENVDVFFVGGRGKDFSVAFDFTRSS